MDRVESDEFSGAEFETIETIKIGELVNIERVRALIDGKTRILRVYRDDKREVFRTLSLINSRYIPHIERVDFNDCCTRVIEQDIDGILLSERIILRKPSKKEVLSMSVQLMTALSELHGHSVIHRDIKPDNIMVTMGGDICLIDFGISRIYRADASRDTSLFGTVGYAAPEQYGFSQTDPRSDLYSAGIVIRELCEAAGLSERDSLYKIAERCSTFDPNRRYKSADAALAEIKSVLKKPLIALCAALLLMSLIGVLSYQYLFGTRQIKLEEDVAVQPPIAEDASKADKKDDKDASPAVQDKPAKEPTKEPAKKPTKEPAKQPSPPVVTPEQKKERPKTAKPQQKSRPEKKPETKTPPAAEEPKDDERGSEAQHPDIKPFVSTPVSIPWAWLNGEVNKIDEKISLKTGEADISLKCELKGDELILRLGDGTLPEQKFMFKMTKITAPKYYEKSSCIGEVFFYDLDHDGRMEIFVILSDSALMTFKDGSLVRLNNGADMWCIGYTPQEGFWRASGAIHSKSELKIDLLDSSEIRTGKMTKCYRLKNRALVEEDLYSLPKSQ